jgi:hypothetical protein
VSTQLPQRDPWRWPALLLWSIFFLLGLWPELSFTIFRAAGYVFSQNAIINSYQFITWCLTGFVIHFVYHRALEAKLPPIEALGKALQMGVVAFVAFIDMPLEQILEIRNATDRALVMGMALVKVLSWLYLLSLFIRYHWRRQPEIIAHAMSLTRPLDGRSERPHAGALHSEPGSAASGHVNSNNPVKEPAE